MLFVINKFYTCLVNAKSSDLSSVIGSDIVSVDFTPVERHSTYQNLFETVFGRSLQSQQFKINRARQIIFSTPLHLYCNYTSLQGGFCVEEISRFLWKHTTPLIIGNYSTLEYSGDFSASDYSVYRYNVSSDNTEVSIRDDSGHLIGSELKESPVTRVTFNQVNGIVIHIPVNLLPFSFVWATKPNRSTDIILSESRPYLKFIANQLLQLPTTFSESDLHSFIDSFLLHESPIALGAIAMLIAKHTAALLDIDL